MVHGYVSGPDNTMVADGGEMRIPFEVHLGSNGEAAS